MNKEKILITAALPYANGPLHFGHMAGAYLPADCYARFKRLTNNNVLFVCGSDEYGIAISLSAELAGRTPQEHVNIFHEINKDLFSKFNVQFDHYSRTTWEKHKITVYQYFNDLLKNGYIEEKVTDQLYSEQDNRFLADRYVVGTCPHCKYDNARGDECGKCGSSYEAIDLIDPRSKLTNASLIKKPTKHWFLMLDRLKEPLIEWINSKNWKPNVINFIKHYISDLRPRAITRDTDWGLKVPLPDSEGKVLYVWFDAPIGYISSSMEWAEKKGNEDLWKDYWLDPTTKFVQFIGKDNIPFHAAIFPAMTMGQNQPFKLVDELPANEFYNLEGKKFSKSEGWYIDLNDFFSKYTSDQIRYAIASNAPENQDSEFLWKDFQAKANADLLGKYGNLVNRVLVFAQKECQGKVPEANHIEDVDKNFIKKIKEIAHEIYDCFDTFKLRKACQHIIEIAQVGNAYFDGKQPWKDSKNIETHARMNTTINYCLECIKILAVVSRPIIPTSSAKVLNFLGINENISWEEGINDTLKANTKLNNPEILFRKIEDDEIKIELEKLYSMKDNRQKETVKSAVTFDDFQKFDIRVGQILEVEKIAKSKKLLKLFVDIGVEKRTIVSGIHEYYSTEELIGKKVAVITNLKPAIIMGVKSEGMILAANNAKGLELLEIRDLPAGTSIN